MKDSLNNFKMTGEELLKKFPLLRKVGDPKFFEELSSLSLLNYCQSIFHISMLLFQDLHDFLEKTKFSSRWEENFSTRVRVEQIMGCMEYLMSPTLYEKTIKNDFVD